MSSAAATTSACSMEASLALGEVEAAVRAEACRHADRD